MLNTEQQTAVLENKHTLVVALPGSGKTKLCVDKIARLLSEFPQAGIGAVTFTRAAAYQLKMKVIESVGIEAAGRVQVGTFHNHCLLQLKESGKRISLIKDGEKSALYMRAREAANLNELSYEQVSRDIETVKSSIDLLPETINQTALFNAYQALLKKSGYFDLQDVIRMCVVGMEDGSVRPKPFQFLLVDEFQDTDSIQYAWVMNHAKTGSMITAVGDDDQSIYSWRHSMGYDGMLQFAGDTGANMITLKLNYRCHKEILDSADRVIKYNKLRVNKTLISDKGPGGAVKVIKFSEREEESIEIAEEILRGPGKWIDLADGAQEWSVPPQSWAILARTNQHLRQISSELRVRGIVHVLGSKVKDVWETPPLSYLLGVLSSLAKNELLGIENALHWKGMPTGAIDRLHSASLGSLKKLCKATIVKTDLSKIDIEAIDRTLALISGWTSQLEKGRLELVVGGVRSWLEPTCKPKEVRDLHYGADLICKRIRGSLADRLRVLTKKNDKDNKREDAVMLITMHGSKGLEFDNVWIVAADHDIIPSVAGEPPSPVEEERRLLYVGMTRAKKRLLISYVYKPSYFLVESGLASA